MLRLAIVERARDETGELTIRVVALDLLPMNVTLVRENNLELVALELELAARLDRDEAVFGPFELPPDIIEEDFRVDAGTVREDRGCEEADSDTM